ncbi:unnamed protein product [Meganyctiphanes norvegica]|uniref:Uncharacterized protein n=1 Tax=Meganyctiphanes norvegica TaxID=48144 RepID=A0AAV2QLT7_MEGNR
MVRISLIHRNRASYVNYLPDAEVEYADKDYIEHKYVTPDAQKGFLRMLGSLRENLSSENSRYQEIMKERIQDVERITRKQVVREPTTLHGVTTSRSRDEANTSLDSLTILLDNVMQHFSISLQVATIPFKFLLIILQRTGKILHSIRSHKKFKKIQKYNS